MSVVIATNCFTRWSNFVDMHAAWRGQGDMRERLRSGIGEESKRRARAVASSRKKAMAKSIETL
jgi:hypothetical protein